MSYFCLQFPLSSGYVCSTFDNRSYHSKFLCSQFTMKIPVIRRSSSGMSWKSSSSSESNTTGYYQSSPGHTHSWDCLFRRMSGPIAPALSTRDIQSPQTPHNGDSDAQSEHEKLMANAIIAYLQDNNARRPHIKSTNSTSQKRPCLVLGIPRV